MSYQISFHRQIKFDYWKKKIRITFLGLGYFWRQNFFFFLHDIWWSFHNCSTWLSMQHWEYLGLWFCMQVKCVYIKSMFQINFVLSLLKKNSARYSGHIIYIFNMLFQGGWYGLKVVVSIKPAGFINFINSSICWWS